MEIDISGLSKVKVFAALYNAARPKGLGFLRYDPTPVSADEAEVLIITGDDHRREFGSLGPEYNDGLCFDYVLGRALKVDLTFDKIAVYAYDEYNGEGMAERAIRHLQETGEVMCPEIIRIQNERVLREDAMNALDDIKSGPTEFTFRFEGRVYKIGIDDPDELRVAISELTAKIAA